MVITIEKHKQRERAGRALIRSKGAKVRGLGTSVFRMTGGSDLYICENQILLFFYFRKRTWLGMDWIFDKIEDTFEYRICELSMSSTTWLGMLGGTYFWTHIELMENNYCQRNFIPFLWKFPRGSGLPHTKNFDIKSLLKLYSYLLSVEIFSALLPKRPFKKYVTQKCDIFDPFPPFHTLSSFVLYPLPHDTLRHLSSHTPFPLSHPKCDTLRAENESKFDVNFRSHICCNGHISYTKCNI